MIFPDAFNASDRVAYILLLVNISTQDGEFGFMAGVDGLFTDVNGKNWYGSQLINQGNLEASINGNAPSGQVEISFIQDPDAPDLVRQIRALGVNYVSGRDITFFIQPLQGVEEFQAPTLQPIQYSRRVMRTISYSASGPQQRSIALSFEGPYELRNTSRGLTYNTVDHERLTGVSNPSLEFIPTNRTDEEKLFG